MSEKKFRVRPFVSLMTTGSFLIMLVTGLMLYIVPAGRVAYWVHWSMLGLEREQWSAIHITASLIFGVFGVWHIYFNWRPLWGYCRAKAAGMAGLRKEMLFALVLSLLIIVGTLVPFWPFTWMLDLNGKVKDSWVTEPSRLPPFGHAELVSIQGLAQKQDIELAPAVQALRAEGVEFSGTDQTLEEVARANGMIPADIYAIMQRFEKKPEPVGEGTWTRDTVEQRFAGTGVGMRTINAIAEKQGGDADAMRQRLTVRGVQFEPGQTIKQIAEDNNMNPIDVLTIMLVVE